MVEEKTFSPKELYELWSNAHPIVYKNKKYSVNKMSYGDYFLEPINWRGKETDGFAPGTLWLEKKSKINRYGFQQIIYVIDESMVK
jgi:hypothetical protein